MGITAKQFASLQQRMASPARRRVADNTSPMTAATTRHAIILGVDPSLRGTGYGIIRLGKPQAQALDHGTIRCPANWERSRCLLRIHDTLRDVIRQHRPEVCAIEGLFFAQNLQTALIMGEARGAALAAVAGAGLEIYELAPRRVKQAIVGFGGAQKIAVARMVQRLLRLAEPPPPDAADALAIAIAHAQDASRISISPSKRV
jgi:crossover junction endodeoxyribonuclease RuvC